MGLNWKVPVFPKEIVETYKIINNKNNIKTVFFWLDMIDRAMFLINKFYKKISCKKLFNIFFKKEIILKTHSAIK